MDVCCVACCMRECATTSSLLDEVYLWSQQLSSPTSLVCSKQILHVTMF
jgi:hypothetical protein